MTRKVDEHRALFAGAHRVQAQGDFERVERVRRFGLDPTPSFERRARIVSRTSTGSATFDRESVKSTFHQCARGRMVEKAVREALICERRQGSQQSAAGRRIRKFIRMKIHFPIDAKCLMSLVYSMSSRCTQYWAKSQPDLLAYVSGSDFTAGADSLAASVAPVADGGGLRDAIVSVR